MSASLQTLLISPFTVEEGGEFSVFKCSLAALECSHAVHASCQCVSKSKLKALYVCVSVQFPLTEQDTSESARTVGWVQDQVISKRIFGKKNQYERRNSAHALFCFTCSALQFLWVFF